MYDKNQYLKAMGRRIKMYRELLGMSMDELAHRAGYESENSRSTISKIEAGQRDLPASKIMAIALSLNVSPSDLLLIEDLESDCDILIKEPAAKAPGPNI